MTRVLVLVVAVIAVAAAAGISLGLLASSDPRASGVPVAAGGPLPLPVELDPEELLADPNAPPMALAPPGGAIIQQGVVRLLKPKIDLAGPRRVGIQVGHWQTDTVPAEYGTRITYQTGTSWEGITEVEVVAEIAERIKVLLEAQGIAVDILPTTVPVGYLADAFVSLHTDGDGVGELSGFKLAHGFRRGPYEAGLVSAIKDAYMDATGLSYDAAHVTRAMLGYYAFNWSRYQHTTSPFTPSVILELGFLSHDVDRELLLERTDVVASAIVKGILTFLDANPRSKIFGEDLLIPAAPIRRGPLASPTAAP